MENRKNYQRRLFLKYLGKYLFIVILIAIFIWAVKGSEVNISNIVRGIPNIFEYLILMIPPSGSVLNKLVNPIIETFQIAIVAIVFSTIIALPFSFLAAKNIMSNIVIYNISRTLLGIFRGIPALLYALIFVSMVGLGPFAGVLALTLHCIGALGRYFSEAIENLDPEILDIAKAVGANKIKTIIYIIIPELSAIFIGYVLYYFEYNVRNSTVLGLVGAGGIGMQLILSIHLFKHREVLTIILIIISIIVVMDKLSTVVRMRLIIGNK